MNHRNSSATDGFGEEQSQVAPDAPAAVAYAPPNANASAEACALEVEGEKPVSVSPHLVSGTPSRAAMPEDNSPETSAQVAGLEQQQQQHDLGGAEHRRAMELLRSADGEGELGGQVIVCSAPDASEEGSVSLTPTTAALTVNPPASGQAFSQGLLGSFGEVVEGISPGRAVAGDNSNAITSLAEATQATAATAAQQDPLAPDDSYIAQLTLKALEHERDDVLKVNHTTFLAANHAGS